MCRRKSCNGASTPENSGICYMHLHIRVSINLVTILLHLHICSSKPNNKSMLENATKFSQISLATSSWNNHVSVHRSSVLHSTVLHIVEGILIFVRNRIVARVRERVLFLTSRSLCAACCGRSIRRWMLLHMRFRTAVVLQLDIASFCRGLPLSFPPSMSGDAGKDEQGEVDDAKIADVSNGCPVRLNPFSTRLSNGALTESVPRRRSPQSPSSPRCR